MFWPWGTHARVYCPCGTPAGNRLALWHPGTYPELASWATRTEFRAPPDKAYRVRIVNKSTGALGDAVAA
jgi:hypothetical protein